MDLDLTLFVQLGLLVLLVPILERLLFKPLLRVLEARQQKIHGTRSEVERLERLSHADRQAYEERMRAARRQAQGEREAQRLAGRDEARRIIDASRARIAATLAQARAEVGASERAAGAQLATQTDAIAELLFARVVGRPVAGRPGA